MARLSSITSARIQDAKRVVRGFTEALDAAPPDALHDIHTAHVTRDYRWRGMRPFYEQAGAAAVVETFWSPLRHSFTALQRREDIFMAGENQHGDHALWTCSMGHFMGLLDHDWTGIPATRKLTFIPYAEFHRVADGRIAETALFLDIVRVMQQAGRDPFPAQTAATGRHPGPRTHDGVLLAVQDPAEGEATRDLLDRMIADLMAFNDNAAARVPPELLARTWHHDMLWFGPGGIGSTFTIPRYQEQHQYPFRDGLTDKVFNGHVCRIAEGSYSGWFGWPNLNNRNRGGFLGLPESDRLAEMRVVDIYRREGGKLAENWVFIDIPHYLAQHGHDILSDWQALHRLARA